MRKMFANIREVHGLRICSRIFDDSKKDCELKKMEKISKISLRKYKNKKKKMKN